MLKMCGYAENELTSSCGLKVTSPEDRHRYTARQTDRQTHRNLTEIITYPSVQMVKISRLNLKKENTSLDRLLLNLLYNNGNKGNRHFIKCDFLY